MGKRSPKQTRNIKNKHLILSTLGSLGHLWSWNGGSASSWRLQGRVLGYSDPLSCCLRFTRLNHTVQTHPRLLNQKSISPLGQPISLGFSLQHPPLSCWGTAPAAPHPHSWPAGSASSLVAEQAIGWGQTRRTMQYERPRTINSQVGWEHRSKCRAKQLTNKLLFTSTNYCEFQLSKGGGKVWFLLNGISAMLPNAISS